MSLSTPFMNHNKDVVNLPEVDASLASSFFGLDLRDVLLLIKVVEKMRSCIELIPKP